MSGRRRKLNAIIGHVERRKEENSRRKELNAMGMPMADNKPPAAGKVAKRKKITAATKTPAVKKSTAVKRTRAASSGTAAVAATAAAAATATAAAPRGAAKKPPTRTSRVGLDLLRACMRAPLCALVSRTNVAEGVRQYTNAAERFGECLQSESYAPADETLRSFSNWLLDSTLAERSHYERLANLCHEMFGTTVLANKYFDETFVTTEHGTVRYPNFSFYRDRVLRPVWRRLRETTCSFLAGPGSTAVGVGGGGGGGGGDDDDDDGRARAFFSFRACLANATKRGKGADAVNREIRTGVRNASTAKQLLSPPASQDTSSSPGEGTTFLQLFPCESVRKK